MARSELCERIFFAIAKGGVHPACLPSSHLMRFYFVQTALLFNILDAYMKRNMFYVHLNATARYGMV